MEKEQDWEIGREEDKEIGTAEGAEVASSSHASSNFTSPASERQKLTLWRDQPSKGSLLGWLVAGFYVLFTLLPDSSTVMVSWPWVFLWQVGLLVSGLWWLWRIWQRRHLQVLGNNLDWLVGFAVLGLIISAALAEFPAPARWYSCAGLGFVAALYAVNDTLDSGQKRYRLLIGQGWLNLAFIFVSLSLWVNQTLVPELVRLQQINQQHGVSLPYDFSILGLRNWAPIGHQNYVAGYLLLAIPLLVGLSVLETGWKRWIWVLGVALGLIDLYTTSSRAGWLGLAVLGIISFAVVLVVKRRNRLWLGLGGVAALAVLASLVLANNRLNTFISAAVNGQVGGELGYRIITNTIGWRMGSSHFWSGVGLGGVPLLYQQYRPSWAGREAELAYQLHSTPAQVYAELGVWGIGTILLAIALLSYLGLKFFRVRNTVSRTDQILTGSIYGGLLAYGVLSLTDYQLDIVAISGTLVIFLAFLASEFRQVFAGTEAGEIPARQVSVKLSQGLAAIGLGILLAVAIWLAPVHWAWQLSSQGFAALSRQDVNTFVQRLQQAHQLAPWEPYYPYQLGWNLGNLSLQPSNQQQQLREGGISWLREGVKVSPYQEFGYTNLAWLLLDRDPKAATQAFARSAQLIPAKRGVFYGLGLSLLAEGKTDLAVQALTLELLRDPLLITSPIWQTPELQPIYALVTKELEAKYTQLLAKYPQPGFLNSYFHQSRGGLRWWRGDLTGARADWERYGSNLSQVVLAVSEGKYFSGDLQQLPPAIAAWFDPIRRPNLLQQAWIQANRAPAPTALMQQFFTGMVGSTTFDQWVKENAPIRQYRRERAGFGVLSRHIDGPLPTDFLPVVENVVMSNFFKELLPSEFYAPQLDLALQPWRDELLKQVVQ